MTSLCEDFDNLPTEVLQAFSGETDGDLERQQQNSLRLYSLGHHSRVKCFKLFVLGAEPPLRTPKKMFSVVSGVLHKLVERPHVAGAGVWVHRLAKSCGTCALSVSSCYRIRSITRQSY